ncbi:hypothetical protein M9458_050442 [Cirrhinus mrigala]|uniref:VLIG-type G domain-containing protein n=1 Tax=Cirrhinus mrigala TaxID=683832 RepID=A0ABD0MYX8_CIRMR
MDISRKQTETKKIRQQQHESDISEFMKLFIKEMNSHNYCENMFFFEWLRILLDEHTSADLFDLQHKYDQKWSTVLKLKEKYEKSEHLRAEQTELERISEDLKAAPFRLEHIMREISQIYESCSSVQKNKKDLQIDFSSLPSLAAEMMICGFPLELMDGDAAHVPVIWISAVLDQLIHKLGDQRVFVLSVLGIRGSGKSTMLNAMFGLQFAVSADRTTRGAFMQLIRVSDEMKTQMNTDYILVVDTEGLHALELTGRSTRHHDNELATFVVGLANLTLINIFGENPSEMQDILQTVVQAFMRMKKVRLNPRCVFVHQNISDVTAGEKNMERRRRLQETLDEMTKLTAEEEDCDAECFSDVIRFDVQNDVKYFDQLWEGNPPMAPPNPNYCENIQELKKTIMTHAAKFFHLLFSEANDPVMYFEKKRVEYYSIFLKYCHGSTSAVIFGEIICQKLKEPIKQSVYKKTARDLTDEMRSNCESLNGNRSNLEKHILKTLAEQEDFDKYMNYIHKPRDHLKSFIRDEVSRFITDQFSVSVLPKMKENIKLLQQKIMKAAHESTQHVQVNRGDVGLWLKRFTQQISDELIFSEKDLSGVKHDDVDDLNLLEDVMRRELTDIMSEISSRFNTETFPVKLDYKFRPDELLIDLFCQCCWVQCPFCKVVCTNTIENHPGDHSAPFHRMSGINGSYYSSTQNLCTEICTNLVASDQCFNTPDGRFKYREYRRAGGVYVMWSISPDLSDLPYWKWFVCRFQNDLEKYYNKTFDGYGKIPYEWRTYSKQDAIESLFKYM